MLWLETAGTGAFFCHKFVGNDMKVKEFIEWLRQCNTDADVSISVDVSTGDSNFGNRVFAEVNEVITTDRHCATVICTETCRNF